jgi:hypothetical protein
LILDIYHIFNEQSLAWKDIDSNGMLFYKTNNLLVNNFQSGLFICEIFSSATDSLLSQLTPDVYVPKRYFTRATVIGDPPIRQAVSWAVCIIYIQLVKNDRDN